MTPEDVPALSRHEKRLIKKGLKLAAMVAYCKRTGQREYVGYREATEHYRNTHPEAKA